MENSLDFIVHLSPWATLAIAALGLGLIGVAVRRRQRSVIVAGAGVLLVAILLAAGRQLIVTPRLKLEKRTEAIVAAVNAKDWKTFASLLDNNTAISTLRYGATAGRADLAAMAEAESQHAGLNSVKAQNIESLQNDTIITVAFDAISLQDDTQDRPLTTSWQFDYQLRGETWNLEKMTLVKVGEASLNEYLGGGR